MLVAAGFFALIVLLWHPVEPVFFRLVLFVFAFFAIQFAIVFLHELGHLVAAIIFRMLPATLVIGAGREVVEFTFGKIAFRFCSSTNEGCVIPNYGDGKIKKSVLVALFAAGPVSDIIVLAIVAKFLFFTPVWLSAHPLFEIQFKPLLYICLGYTFYYQVAYLLDPKSYSEGQFTDARGIADAFNYIPAPAPVLEAFNRLEKRFFDSAVYLPDPLPTDSEDLKTYTQWALARPRTTALETRNVKDLFITATILYGWTDNLALADIYSRELLSDHPKVITCKGSRGAVLVELGKLEEGKSLLMEVFTRTKSDVDRVISAAFIAIAEHRLGNPAAAQDWLARAITIDPSSVAVKRARSIIETCDVSDPSASSTATTHSVN